MFRWHSGLLAKLAQAKVNDKCLDLFKSYLTKRKQFVVVGDCKSETKDVLAGTAQGSRLGPLLWILYVNDIIENLESEVLLFADDTSLMATADDPFETSQILNRDLQKILSGLLIAKLLSTVDNITQRYKTRKSFSQQ